MATWITPIVRPGFLRRHRGHASLRGEIMISLPEAVREFMHKDSSENSKIEPDILGRFGGNVPHAARISLGVHSASWPGARLFFPNRAAAALRAIFERCPGVNS